MEKSAKRRIRDLKLFCFFSQKLCGMSSDVFGIWHIPSFSRSKSPRKVSNEFEFVPVFAS
jgi:hypothetical protein